MSSNTGAILPLFLSTLNGTLTAFQMHGSNQELDLVPALNGLLVSKASLHQGSLSKLKFRHTTRHHRNGRSLFMLHLRHRLHGGDLFIGAIEERGKHGRSLSFIQGIL